MHPVAVGGLHHQVVRGRHRVRVEHHRVVVAAQVPGEDDPPTVPGQVHRRRTENVTGAPEGHRRPGPGHLELRPERPGGEQLHCVLCVVAVVERQRRVVLAGLVLVHERRIAFLQVGTVPEDDLGDRGGPLGADDGAGETVADQPRQIAGVIEVGMGEDDRVDRVRVDGQRGPVEFAQVLDPLEQTAVDQDPGVVGLQQVLGAGDGAGRPQAAQSERLPLNGTHVLSLAAWAACYT